MFRIYPGVESQFTVYAGTEVRCGKVGGQLTINLSSIGRAVVLEILAEDPGGITRDGKVLLKLATQVQFEGAQNGWLADAPAHLVQVKVQHLCGTTTIAF